MIETITSVRRAKTRRERLRGRRWVAAYEFPGGRKIVLKRDRTKPPVLARARTAQLQKTNSEANAGTVTVPSGQTGGGSYPEWKEARSRQNRVAIE